jgi:hypothetical protein
MPPTKPSSKPRPTAALADHCRRVLEDLDRDELLSLARRLTRIHWVREALRFAEPEDLVVLGLFDLVGPDSATPWPALLVGVRRRPRLMGHRERSAIVAAYSTDGESAWEVSVKTGPAAGPCTVPWLQYRGEHSGPAGLVNGDLAGLINLSTCPPTVESCLSLRSSGRPSVPDPAPSSSTS